MAAWASNNGQNIKSGLPHDRRAKFLPSVVGVVYDWLRIEGHLGNVGSNGVAHTLLDVREVDEVAVCSIADSLCIPMQQVPQHLAELPREHPLIIMCHHGSRSDQVAHFLRSYGFTNVHNLAGGINVWAQFMDPDMARY